MADSDFSLGSIILSYYTCISYIVTSLSKLCSILYVRLWSWSHLSYNLNLIIIT